MKILAIDPGTKRIGLAATDSLQLTTRLLPVLRVRSLKDSLQNLVELVAEEEFSQVVIGLPLNMDGSEGPAAAAARNFAAGLRLRLEKAGLKSEVLLWDERLTSFEAENRCREQGSKKAKTQAFLDSLAAEVLLEDYLSAQKRDTK